MLKYRFIQALISKKLSEKYIKEYPLEANISIYQIIADASLFVKFIMLVLFLMLLTTIFWTGKKAIYFLRIEQKIAGFKSTFWNERGVQISLIYDQYREKDCEAIEQIFKDGYEEFKHFLDKKNFEDPDAIVHNCRRAMEAAVRAENAKQEKGLDLLATFGSSAPYIGLLGTVFGIMHAFISLGSAQNTTINTVAPAIAEALIATAIGLAAAIPSVLSYNAFISKSEKINVEYDTFIERFCNLMQRQIMNAKKSIERAQSY